MHKGTATKILTSLLADDALLAGQNNHTDMFAVGFTIANTTLCAGKSFSIRMDSTPSIYFCLGVGAWHRFCTYFIALSFVAECKFFRSQVCAKRTKTRLKDND